MSEPTIATSHAEQSTGLQLPASHLWATLRSAGLSSEDRTAAAETEQRECGNQHATDDYSTQLLAHGMSSEII
jgi:hypothetical protein